MKETLSLAPNSLLQFKTVGLSPDCAKLRVQFWEQPTGQDETGAPVFTLRVLEEDPDSGEMMVVERDRRWAAPPDVGYRIGRKDVFEMLEGRWVPLPYLAYHEGGEPRRGPSNWARGRLRRSIDASGAETLEIDLAFDTHVPPADDEHNEMHQFAPTPVDVSRGQRFIFTSDLDQVAWLIHADWLSGWLAELLRQSQEAVPGRSRRNLDDDAPRPLLRHQAIYIAYLMMLATEDQLPDVRLLSIAGEKPVDIDLVLDLGNFRSCGILIEEHPGDGQRETDSYALALRDLSNPQYEYTDPFSSRVEFSRPNFGDDFYSRRSGADRAFVWPSPVRTGPEAERLMGVRIGTEGLSGLSAPKRYLWDTRPSDQGWRFNTGPSRGNGLVDPDVKAPFRRVLHDLLKEGRLRAHREDNDAANPIVPCCLSRSQIFILMLSELILQAVMYMNSPDYRTRRRDSARPRRLRSLMLTMPPGMPVAEQRILRLRAQTAIRFVWKQLGQTDPVPVLRAELDEATATQIVWLHNEVTQRLGGNVEALFELYGASEDNSAGPPQLRVASIDIGGGTTDLMITTYSYAGGDAIEPRQDFRESVNLAGDDLLERVIATIVVPSIASALKAHGVVAPQDLLRRILTRDHGNQDERDRHQRRLFVATVLEPAALRILEQYENIDAWTQGDLPPFTLGDTARVVHGSDGEAQRSRCMAFLQRQFAQSLGPGGESQVAEIDFYAITIRSDTNGVESAIRETLDRVIDDLSEVVGAYRCDLLLLSGRPSKLRRVRDAVTSAMPVAPHRIIAMHDYRVGPHYPFADSAHRIADPKTTVVVGAALCIQAEGKLTHFVLRTRALRMRSTARFIGKIDKAGQIWDRNHLLENVDLDSAPTRDDVMLRLPDFEGRTIIGFRQLPQERWWTNALYSLSFRAGREETIKQLVMPLTVSLIRDEATEEDDEDGDFSAREMFKVEEISDAEGTVVSSGLIELRLQTTQTPEGYWRDTGCLRLDTGA